MLTSSSTVRLVTRPSLVLVVRQHSSHWPSKKPRCYRRRLFEATLAPMELNARRVCPSFGDFMEQVKRNRDECTEFDLALINHVRQKLITENCQVIGICQQLSVKSREEWLVRNKFRQKGVDLKTYNNFIIRQVFNGTPLQTLEPLLVAPTCQLLGHSIEAIQTIIDECKRVSWLIPLAIVYGTRILSMSEANRLCEFGSIKNHRGRTVHILAEPLNGLVGSLNYHLLDTTSLLAQFVEQQRKP